MCYWWNIIELAMSLVFRVMTRVYGLHLNINILEYR